MDATLKHPVSFRVEARSCFTKLHKENMCGKPDLRLSEVAKALDFVITAKSRSLVTPTVRLCCALKRSLNAAGWC